MAMGRGLKVYHNLPQCGVAVPSLTGEDQVYSLVIEQRTKNEVILLEYINNNYIIISQGLNEFEVVRKNYTKISDGYGCLGVMRINAGAPGAGENILYFLVMITGCNSVGKLGNSDIYRITNIHMISMRGIPADEERVSEIKKLLVCGTFYFAWAPPQEGPPIDLSLAAQKCVKHTTTDFRFFWNRTLYIPFIRFGVNPEDWLTKVMCGSVEIRTVYVGSRQAKAAVISRLSSERAGTRFQTRGVNDYGQVANFAESEQVIYLGDETSSFVQVRGSVPLFWEQPGINVGSHKIRLSRGPELSVTAFDLHLKKLKQNYGNQAIVNLLGSSLVGSKEGEATLSTAFQTHHKLCEHHNDIPHILFDYHQEVKSGSSKNLAKLKAKVQRYVEKFGFFTKKGPDVLREQFGTVRTNCTDCLDRTNCVQTFLGLEVLNFQLVDLGLTDKPNIVSRFEELFRQMWISNGNELSKMYAGTAALQGGSKIMDGARSAARTIQNNLLDSSKQESIDVLLYGSSFNSNLADRARVFLPPNYINAPRPLLMKLISRRADYTQNLPLRVAVGTYNINGGKHFRSIVYKDVSLSDWLLDAHKSQKEHALIDLSQNSTDELKPIDIYAIGFEEMVDLDAKNIMNTSSENSKAWATELTRILNRDEKYALITYQQLVGVCLYVFVRPEHAEKITDVAIDFVKTGMGGATGNKGTVAIRMRYLATSLCFVCSHFAAGQSAVGDRNNDFNEAVKKILFPMGRTLLSHDYVFWCGDFNYRISMPRDEVAALCKEGDLTTLLSGDQLKKEQEANNVFQGFQEGPINFLPTYKYDLFSDDYDTSEKSRIPAWTDRVLWRGPKECPGTNHWYGRAELKQSDHRPVLSIIDIEVSKILTDVRETVFEEALESVGPPDGSILLQFENGVSFDILTVIDDHFMSALRESLASIGSVRFLKLLHDTFWVSFEDPSKAVEAVDKGPLSVCGHELTIRLKSPNWRSILESELEICSDKTLALCGDKELNLRKESARLLSQLSQLSFEELGDMTLSSGCDDDPLPEIPSKPPPPRPAPPARPSLPPARPGPPPARPAPPPARTEEPPSRPAPPPARPVTRPSAAPISDSAGEHDWDPDRAGFSDIFGVTSPVGNDVPISLSSGSLVGLGTFSEDKMKETSNPPSPEIEDQTRETNGPACTPPDEGPPTKPPNRQASTDSNASGPGTPTKLPPAPKRAPPPPLPTRPPPGPPPALPGRPPSGPPPPLPKRQ